MYLLEESPEARAMRQNVINLLQSDEDANVELAFQLIKTGGMHQEIVSFLQNKYERCLSMSDLETLNPLLMPFVIFIGEYEYYGIASRTLHNELSLCKNLKIFTLPLGSNVLHLPDWVGKWENLESFFMIHSHLVNLPESVGNWTFLNSLSIINNELLCLPESVGNWRNLTHLNLCNNQLTSLPTSAKNWVNLKTIDISGNFFPNLPAKLQKRYEIQGDWQALLDQINLTVPHLQ